MNKQFLCKYCDKYINYFDKSHKNSKKHKQNVEKMKVNMTDQEYRTEMRNHIIDFINAAKCADEKF